jgi:hypothetical protein
VAREWLDKNDNNAKTSIDLYDVCKQRKIFGVNKKI